VWWRCDAEKQNRFEKEKMSSSISFVLLSLIALSYCKERLHYYNVDVCEQNRRSEREEVVTIHTDSSACVRMHESKFALRYFGADDHIELCPDCDKTSKLD
jgi:hypothetical protein